MKRNNIRGYKEGEKSTKGGIKNILWIIKKDNEAITITLIYCFFGVLWILLSDMLLELIFQRAETYKTFQLLQTLKGWFYILVTTSMLYILIHKRILMLKEEIGKSAKTYEKLRSAHEDLVKVESELKFMAFYDSRTGLPNRAMFENEVNIHLIKNTGSNDFMIAYIDIDNFKNINDSLGHQAGDQFLKYFADCLRAEIKEPNFVARMGGDEFAILYAGTTKEQLLDNIDTIRKRISSSWSIQNHQFYISMSVGVVVYPRDGDNLTELLKNADITMYSAKKEGRNRVLFYEESIKENNSWQAAMINNLQYGMEREQFTLFYQPQFKLVTGEIMGMEVLVRWAHPEEGYIPPSKFIPLAEETGQIYRLERWIVAKALNQKKLWEEQGLQDLFLSINLSGKTLTSEINFHELEHIILQYSVDFSKVVIEVTETASISDVDVVIAHLGRLKRMGLRIALDDFGTGYSSLNYLKKFPIDIIKLDKSFIDSISVNELDNVLIKHIIYLARDMKFEVIAEGIETQEQLDYLRMHYCESGQGYLLSRPLPEDKMLDLINSKLRFEF